jgi:molybdenum cofactor biosynthesis protein B
MSVTSHRAAGPASVGCSVITISDTRTITTDTSGIAIVDLLTEAGHNIAGRHIVKDEPTTIAALIRAEIKRTDVHAIITTGGTGIAARDSTYEAVAGLFDKTLDGFGELFRMLSFGEIGSAAMLSRACAGVASGCAIFVLPGSEAAVNLAMERLILPELRHVVAQIGKDTGSHRK